jgi:integrase
MHCIRNAFGAADVGDAGRLLAVAERSSQRDLALIARFMGTGIRRQEAVGLDVTDIIMHADQSGMITVRHAKKVKGRTVPAAIAALLQAMRGRRIEQLRFVYPLTASKYACGTFLEQLQNSNLTAPVWVIHCSDANTGTPDAFECLTL